MEIEELGIKGAWIARSPIHNDDRGYFREWFKDLEIEAAIGRCFNVRQANVSSSNKGVLRGIHYSIAKEGQAKWITCISGAIWDVVVDIRQSSPTFMKWVGVDLRANSGDSLFVSEGLGHGFVSLEDNSTVAYLLTSQYSPSEEFEIHPFAPDLAIAWPLEELLLSAKDKAAPTLQNRLSMGGLVL
jgi:dTDP-4-dehydrorhamnose 3,5-epimerase